MPGGLFPENDIIPIHLDWPLPRAAYAWEALDAIVIIDAPPPDDATIAAVAGRGRRFFIAIA